MSYYRTEKRNVINNNNLLYNKKFIEKGVKSIIHYGTQNFTFPSNESFQDINFISHIWTQGDSFEKLASQYYGNPIYWWIIPFFNKKPTEQHFLVGDTIYIPTPLIRVISATGL